MKSERGSNVDVNDCGERSLGNEVEGGPQSMAIFSFKKLKRNGLLERKIIKSSGQMTTGRWTKGEHLLFMKACLKYGPKWKMIQQEVRTRTTAQIRSHAQKYVIKLCKRYNIEIKSKRRDRFVSEHMNYPYKRKSRSITVPVEKMTGDDKRFIQNFNFYEKNIDFAKIEEFQSKREKDIFIVGKTLGARRRKKRINIIANFVSQPDLAKITKTSISEEGNLNSKRGTNLTNSESRFDKIFEIIKVPRQNESSKLILPETVFPNDDNFPQSDENCENDESQNIIKSAINTPNCQILEEARKILTLFEQNILINNIVLGYLSLPLHMETSEMNSLSDMINFIISLSTKNCVIN